MSKPPSTPARSRRHRHLHLVIPAMQAARRTAGRIDRSKPTRPKLVGYYSAGKVPSYTRQREVNDWKDHVREHVNMTQIPAATRTRPVRVDVHCFYPDWAGADPLNVYKLLTDTLYPSKHARNAVAHAGEKQGDKYVYGFHAAYAVDAANPRVEVTITWEDDQEDPQ